MPSVWPGLPPHLTKPPPPPRPTTMASSEARQSNVEAMEVFREEAERAIDSITSLDELKYKIKDIELPATVVCQENHILFVSITYVSKPEITFSLYVDKDMKYELWYWGKQIKKIALK